MAKVEHYFTRFEEGEFYHIYNRTVDKKLMFKNEENHLFFLKKLQFYLDGVITIYAYCLLENHFHFLIKITDNLEKYKAENKVYAAAGTHDIVSRQLRRFFQCYALSFNKQHGRCGTLFQTPFKRVRVKNNPYLIYLIYYIHSNSQKHELVADFKHWNWSSYNNILEENTPVNQEIISWFGGVKHYINFHATHFDNL